MAIKVNGTTVINDSRVLSDVTGLKTVGGTSILGSGNIDAGASTAVNGVGTYTLAVDTGMTDSSSGNSYVYKAGRTASGSAIRTRAVLAAFGVSGTYTGTSTSGTSVSIADNKSPGGYNPMGVMTDNNSYSGSWRLMSPCVPKIGSGSFASWGNQMCGLWVRYS
jgi:hypothetical protein